MQRVLWGLLRINLTAQRGDLLNLLPAGGRSTRASTSREQLHFYSSKSVPKVATSGVKGKSEAKDHDQELDRFSELDTFFSSRAPMSPSPLDADNHQLLEHCNKAVVLSRSSSEPKTFEAVRIELQCASHLFDQIVQVHRNYGVEPDMSYEVFLLRSSWLQVVRTILALVKGEAVQVCSLMMYDYLQWEHTLLNSGLRIKDGTERVPELQPAQVLSPKAKEIMEEQYFHGPFIQDAAPVLHELFSYMTTGNEKAIAHAVNMKRSYKVVRKYGSDCRSVGMSLWEAIRQIDRIHWRKPLSLEWLRICDRTEYKSGQELVASCMLMHAEALCVDDNKGQIRGTDDSLSVWHDGVDLCRDGCEFYTRKLMGEILSSIRKAGLNLSVNSGSSIDDIETIRDYFRGIERLAEVMERIILTENEAYSAMKKQDVETAIRFVLASEGMFRRKLILLDESSRESISYHITTTSDRVISWFHAWLSDKSSLPMPTFRTITTYNRILERLLCSGLFHATINSMTMCLLKKLSSDSTLPSPDETTISMVIKLANQCGSREIRSAALLLARGRLDTGSDTHPSIKQSGESRPIAASVKSHDLQENANELTPMLALIEDALKRADISRLQTLISTASPTRFSDNPTHLSKAKFHVENTFIQQITFYLYPSLDLNFRREAILTGESGRVPSREEIANSTAFHPRVLSAVFVQVVAAGLTGLGERVWRLIKRCTLRPVMNPHWQIMKTSVYTTLMRIYKNEVRAGSRLLRQRKLQRSESISHRPQIRNSLRQRTSRFDTDLLPRGWGYIMSGPGRARLQRHEKPNRVVLARAIAKSEYGELKQRWENGTAEKPDAQFWKIFLSIFRKGANNNADFEFASEDDRRFIASIKEDMDESHHHLCNIPSNHHIHHHDEIS